MIAMGNGDFDRFIYGNGVVGVDQSGHSDSNSEVSGAESVGTNRINLSSSGDNEKINLPYIDFLGVGL